MAEVIGQIGPQGIVDQDSPQQAEDTSPEDDIEVGENTTEQKNEQQEQGEVDEFTQARIRKEIRDLGETATDMRGYLPVLRHNLDPEMTDWAIQLVQKDMAEKFADSAPSVEKLKEVTDLLRHLESTISEQDSARLAEMAKDPNYKGAIEKKDRIIDALVTPVLLGHVSGKDVASLIKKIGFTDGAEQKQAQTTHGYEGVMYYDEATGSILINPEKLVDSYRTKKESKPLRINFEHLASHELSHGVVRKLALDRGRTEPSRALLRMANQIIEGADSIADSQSQHINTVLRTLANVDEDFKTAGANMTLEQFRAQRKVNAANEIITDYMALYLQSDGSMKDFTRVCLEMTREKNLNQYIANGGSKEQLIKTYEVFYKSISSVINRGKGLSLEEEGDDEEDEPTEVLEEDELGSGESFQNTSEGFAEGDKNEMQGQTKSGIMALVGAFAEEVETVTKPVSSAAA